VQREDLLDDYVAVIRRIASDIERAASIGRLAAYLSLSQRHDLVGGELRRARTMDSEYKMIVALSHLAPHMPTYLVSEALDLVRELSSPYGVAVGLVGLAPRTPVNLAADVVAMARGLESERNRALVMVKLLSPNPPEVPWIGGGESTVRSRVRSP
jgi:hypothetical protein